jgi:hypothetical protein
MAKATTTLAAALGLNDTVMSVASSGSFAAGRIALIDQEIVQVASSYVSGTLIPILRGKDGSKTVAHVITAAVTHGLPSDFAQPVAQQNVTYAVSRPVVVTSVTTTSTSLTLPDPGSDWRVVINLATAISLTIPVPTKDMDGTTLMIVSSTVAAHAVIFTGGFGGVGSGYTTLTASTGAQLCVGPLIACNGTWNIPCGPHFASGTETKINSALS